MTEDQNWETLTVAENEAMGELLQQELEKAGIPSVLDPSGVSAYMGASAPLAVKVPKDKFEQAKEFLK